VSGERAIADAAARLTAVAASGSVLVQSPAGSGKTTLLVQRYLRLLAAVEAPEHILALTFTRRAAAEMRERVMGALEAASLGECPQHLNPHTFELAVAARRRLEARRIDVERQPSRLRIETIDSFNAWVAAQLPITSGIGGRLNLLEDARPLYRAAARRALTYDARDTFGVAVDRVLEVGDQRWRELVELVADMLASRDRWLPLLAGRLQAAAALDEQQLERVRQHFDEDLELLVTRALQSIHEALGAELIARVSPHLAAAARRVGEERPSFAEWRVNASALEPNPRDLGRWRALADVFLKRDDKLRKRLVKNDGFPAECAEKAPMAELLAQLERRPLAVQALGKIRWLPEPRYRDDDWARVREVAQLLVLAAAELDRVFREEGALDFPAVSIAALRALGDPESPTDLALRLDYRLQHILLDEFQDTSSAQLELVRLLTAGWQRGDGRTVFCVGDPMQSIYGFRRAEVRAFLELAEDGIGEVEFEVERLSSNFRAARPLVDWVNERFALIMPRKDDRERGAIAFRPSTPASAISEASSAVRLHGFTTRSAEALAAAALIEERLRQHSEWRIAVLVRARSHALEIADALRARGIAFRALDIEPLQDRAAVRDVVMLDSALTHLGDRTAWLAVLRAPWGGLTLADLLVVARSESILWEAICDEAVLAQLSPDGRSRCRRIREVLEAAFRVRTHTPLARWVERTWLGLGGAACAADERELAEVRRVFARLKELGRALPDAADFAGSFADLYADSGSSSAVEIMTIHKAKGLEFDMVLLPALDRYPGPERSQLLLMHPFARSDRDGMVMAARPAIGADADRLFQFLVRQAREASALEAERLLYVACTRAKRELHLSATLRDDPEEGAAIDDGDDEAGGEATVAEATAVDRVSAAAAGESRSDAAPWKPRVGSLLAVLWPVAGREFVAAAGREAPAMPARTTPQASRAPSGTVATPRPISRLPLDWSPPLEGDAELGTISIGSLARREETPAFDWASETARCVGSLVHAELSVMDVSRVEEAAIRARGAHFRRWLAIHGVPAERLEEAGERVIAALLAVHRDPRGWWILRRGYRDDYREHALSGSCHGEVVRVVFDRSFIDERGIRWVIDYKTSQHTGSGLEEFLDREVERYRPQLERYAMVARKLGPEPVRVGLYFPLIGAWREWTP